MNHVAYFLGGPMDLTKRAVPLAPPLYAFPICREADGTFDGFAEARYRLIERITQPGSSICIYLFLGEKQR